MQNWLRKSNRKCTLLAHTPNGLGVESGVCSEDDHWNFSRAIRNFLDASRPHAEINVPGLILVGLQVTLIGRFWVTPEAEPQI